MCRFVEEAKIIDTVLSWPVEWSGVNGIAELVAPPVIDHVPALQFVQEAAPDDDHVPRAQVKHPITDIAANAFEYVPALHVLHEESNEAPEVDE